MLKLDRDQFLWKIHFWSNLGEKFQKMGLLAFFENYAICLFFLKSMQNKTSSNSYLFIAKPMSGKILALKLLPIMFLTNQISAFVSQITYEHLLLRAPDHYRL